MNAAFEDHLLHLKNAFADHHEFFIRLRDEVKWDTIQWRTRPLPRLCYRSVQETSVGLIIANWLTIFCATKLNTDVTIHDIFGNYYRNGKDYLPQHSDNYTDGENKMHVISISFGASRCFKFQKFNKTHQALMLDAGDLVIFDPYMNQNYTHGIEKAPNLTEGRINLTCFVTFSRPPYGSKIEGPIMSASEMAVYALLDQEYGDN